MALGQPLAVLGRVGGGECRPAPLKRAAEVKRKRCRRLLSGGGGVDEHMADGPKAAVGEAASGEAPQAYTAGGVPARGGGGAKAALGGRGPAGRGWLACAAPLQTNGHANQPPCSGAGLAGGRGGAARWRGGRKKKQEKAEEAEQKRSERSAATSSPMPASR
jgi:hypothetical protein